MKYYPVLCIIFCLLAGGAQAQHPETEWLRHHISALSHDSLHGRGYVQQGGAKSAAYLARFYREHGLRSFLPGGSYFQPFSFSVNTFPGKMSLELNKKKMRPGVDYIVHAASRGATAEKMPVETIDLAAIHDTAGWETLLFRLHGSGKAFLLQNADTLMERLQLRQGDVARALPAGIYIVPKHGKLIWTVATASVPATICYVEDTVLPRNIKTVSLDIENTFEHEYISQNVIGFVPGIVRPDSFIVFTAHFDHLGRMGEETLFPGAHDNASGTAVMLYLARYFSRNPQRYSIAFMGFSGEEAGLLGSHYYVENPLFPLEKIRFLVNLDMTGDATEGITVINGLEEKQAFAAMDHINQEELYLPAISPRELTKNSDHYPFAAAGVPAVFIYGRGAKGYYHDVFDRADELSLYNIDQLIFLLLDFTRGIQR